tara:strand:+ start:480 stop:1379 length:900 start_codon:yes stop_codon:yes gene_type:complete
MIELPKGVDLQSLLLFLKRLGCKSSSMLRDFESESILLYKSPESSEQNHNEKDLVTAADLELNKLITEDFLINFPNIKWEIVTEENAKNEPHSRYQSNSEWTWFVDPLDGTRDFVQKSGEYAVHLGLIFKNKPILGMVLLPSLKELWFGVNGIGTWVESEDISLKKKEFENIPSSDPIKVLTSKNHNNSKLEFILREMDFKNVVRMGSIGFKVCNLLKNQADIYLSISDKTSPKHWDIAAPHALLDNSRCNFTYASGENINYQQKDYLQEGCLIASTLSNKEHLNICKNVNTIIKEFDL